MWMIYIFPLLCSQPQLLTQWGSTVWFLIFSYIWVHFHLVLPHCRYIGCGVRRLSSWNGETGERSFAFVRFVSRTRLLKSPELLPLVWAGAPGAQNQAAGWLIQPKSCACRTRSLGGQASVLQDT